MLRVGLAGYGFMGKMHTQCHAAAKKSQIVAMADVDAAKRAEGEKLGWKCYASIGEMLAAEKLDVVDICTPTFLHEECVLAAAKAGAQIMCEKPLSLTLDACDHMIAAAEKANVNLMVGHVIRFWPEYQVIKELLDSGKYGKITWVSARRLSPAPNYAWDGWLLDPKRSGGAVLDLHIHDLDYLNYILGAPQQTAANWAAGPNGGVDMVMTSGWGYKSGAKSIAEGGWALPGTFPFNMALTVVCEKATFKFDMAASPSLMVYPEQGDAFAPEVPEPKVESTGDAGGNLSSLGGYFNEIQYYMSCVEAGRKPEVVTPQDAREAVRLCLAAREAAQSGKIVNM
jgi:predicted dehydrogenase